MGIEVAGRDGPWGESGDPAIHSHGMTDTVLSPQLLTTAELAHRWYTTEQAVYAARYRGACPRAARVGRRLLFRLSDVLAWEERRTEAGPS